MADFTPDDARRLDEQLLEQLSERLEKAFERVGRLQAQKPAGGVDLGPVAALSRQYEQVLQRVTRAAQAEQQARERALALEADFRRRDAQAREGYERALARLAGTPGAQAAGAAFGRYQAASNAAFADPNISAKEAARAVADAGKSFRDAVADAKRDELEAARNMAALLKETAEKQRAEAAAFAQTAAGRLPLEAAGGGADLHLAPRAPGGAPEALPAGGGQTGGGRGAVFGSFAERAGVSLQAGAEKVGAALSAVGSVASAAGGLASSFVGVGKSVESFVAKANPSSVERFNIALEDVQAVLGQALTPVLDVVTEGVRLFGDFLTSILPSADEFKEILAPVSDLFGELREALAAVAPFVKDVLTVALKALGVALNIVLYPVKLLARFLGSLFGAGEADPLKSSVGAAVRNVQFTGQQQFAQSVYAAAFRAGTGGARDPYTGHLDKISGTLDDISGVVKAIFAAMPRNPLGDVAPEIKQGVDAFSDRVNKAWRDRFDRQWEDAQKRYKTDPGYRRQADEAAGAVRGVVDTLYDWLGQSRRRGLDGHPGSGGY
jgi:hypothetical protein